MDVSLSSLGWNEWFSSRTNVCSDNDIARVISVDRDQLSLANTQDHFTAKLSGRFYYDHPNPDEHPCVGDWVCVSKSTEDQHGQIHQVLERKSWLRRKAAGDSVEYQMIAANIDTVMIVISCHYDFNLKRLERYLVMVKEGMATSVIVLTKTDLVTTGQLDELIHRIRQAGITEQIIALSSLSGEGCKELVAQLQPAQTYCFVGSSGVGKSTLINHLLGNEILETSVVSATGEGRHTTVRRELIQLVEGAIVIDNPGMREFGVLDAKEGIEGSFAEITALVEQCRFRDCTHTNEPGCAILKAIKHGEIDEDHYHNYLKLRAESDFYQLSYAQKRQKDKDFGKLIKNVKKDLRKRS